MKSFDILVAFAAAVSFFGLVISIRYNTNQKEKPRQDNKALVKHPLSLNPMVWAYIIFIALGWGVVIYFILSGKYPVY